MTEPIRVVVSGAAGQIAYSLCYMIGRGEVFGKDQPIILHLHDMPENIDAIRGVAMELIDCSLPLLSKVETATNVAAGFKDVKAAFLVGAKPRTKGMQRKDLLAINAQIFKAQGQAINKYAHKDVKVLVVGNPANTNCMVCSHYAPTIPRENFTALTRLDHNRARAQIALKLGVPTTCVKNVIIWGNHSLTLFPDLQHAAVCVDGRWKAVWEVIDDTYYLHNTFIENVQKRGEVVIDARRKSSAMSAAKAACDHMHDWWNGTKPGEYVSMGVLSDGSYGVPKDIVFSYPVEISNGKWKIVQGLSETDFARSKLNISATELVEEKAAALALFDDYNTV